MAHPIISAKRKKPNSCSRNEERLRHRRQGVGKSGSDGISQDVRKSAPLTEGDSRRGNRRSVTRDGRPSLQRIIRKTARVSTALREGVRRCRITSHSSAGDVAVSRPSRPSISCTGISRTSFRVSQEQEKTCKRRNIYVSIPGGTPETSHCLRVDSRRRRGSARGMTEADRQQ